jgi:NAD-dependent DNA ligase
LARFNDLALKEGDLIKVTYVNDVMPYVSRLECSHNRDNPNEPVKIITKCPICGSDLVISDSGKSLICPNFECEGRSTQRITNMLQKLNIKGFADATVKALHIRHLHELKGLTLDYLVSTLGEADGLAFNNVIQSLLNDQWQDYVVMGSLGFSNIARKKWQAILSKHTLFELYMICMDYSGGDRLYRVLSADMQPGVARVIADEFLFFQEDIEFILNDMHIIDSKGNSQGSNVIIRFSGCRNLSLCQLLSSQGIDIDGDSGVTKNTDILLVPYKGFTSGKVSKAEKYGTSIMTESEFNQNYDAIIKDIIARKNNDISKEVN